ncbi:hypothetical protein HQQ94_02460 [Shewanella sp. VB17]|uniref:ABC transporter substrate-binding protein n=1 Tax=Shewanella sp. VB17 TaxID=2739432 RepID=UPI00156721CB|nr:hypothetical protein [Shewanella sp. VB17]NRD72121.1 hypothetical protein [Shewanella sp. VB17]
MRYLLLLLSLIPLKIIAASILIIESYHQEYGWDINYNRGIISILGDEHKYQNFYMDTKRIPQDQFDLQAKRAWETYNALKPDIVVLADDNAIKLLHKQFENTTTPIVVLGVNANPRSYGIHNKKNFTGVLERPLFKRSLLFVKKILPENPKKKILVLFDKSPTSLAAMQQISPSLESLTIGNVTSDFILTNSFNTWKNTVITAKEKGYDAMLVGLYHTINNASNQYVAPDDVISWTQKNAQLPHFGFWQFTVGENKNIGGYVLDSYVHGQLAGELIDKILAGALPSSLPYISDRTGIYMMSKSGINKWKLTIPEKITEKVRWVD